MERTLPSLESVDSNPYLLRGAQGGVAKGER